MSWFNMLCFCYLHIARDNLRTAASGPEGVDSLRTNGPQNHRGDNLSASSLECEHLAECYSLHKSKPNDTCENTSADFEPW